MSSTDTLYTARFRLPDLVEQGRDEKLIVEVYRDKKLVEPDGTQSSFQWIRPDSNVALTVGPPLTVTGKVAEATIPGATSADENLSEGWLVEWSLRMPDGITHIFRNDAALVRRRLYPPITDLDIHSRLRSLDPDQVDTIVRQGSYQARIDDAWITIQLRLINQGNRPNLILSPSAFREVMIQLVLARIFDDLAAHIQEDYAAKAADHMDRFEREWKMLNFAYDRNDDGQTTRAEKRRSAQTTIWLTGR